MKVSEVMTQDVRLIEPTQTLRDAARMMAELDAGILPVREGDRLVGKSNRLQARDQFAQQMCDAHVG